MHAHAGYMHACIHNLTVLMTVASWLVHDGRLYFLGFVEFLLMIVEIAIVLSLHATVLNTLHTTFTLILTR